jgi:hypothetical protein
LRGEAADLTAHLGHAADSVEKRLMEAKKALKKR